LTFLPSSQICVKPFPVFMVEKELKRIFVNESLCSGCLACEIACVVQHEGVFGTAAARIHVVKRESDGLDQPHVCISCDPAPCIKTCPAGALYRDNVSGIIVLTLEDCTGCWMCIDVCPQDAILIHPETGLVLICDLCGGDPACVKRCATGALVFIEDVSDGSVEGV
jgi:carbon-monoxide dehydrogenase iron sulfur subunit